MEKYPIGEISSKLGVTSSFLKYYEQQGLIQPVTAANGYRYYTVEGTSLVCECVRLKNLGFSAREIQTMLSEADYDHMLSMLSEKRGEMEKQIRYLNYLLGWYDRMTTELPSYDKESCWSIGIHNDFYFFPQSIGTSYLDDPQADKLTAEWMKWMPVTLSTARADYRLPRSTPVEWGLSLDKPFADSQGIPVHAPAIYVPNCRCLEYWDKRELQKHETTASELFVHMKDIVEKYHLVITGPSYFFVRTKLHENGKMYTYQKILTPIE